MVEVHFIETMALNLKVFGNMANFKNISVDMHMIDNLTIY